MPEKRVKISFQHVICLFLIFFTLKILNILLFLKEQYNKKESATGTIIIFLKTNKMPC